MVVIASNPSQPEMFESGRFEEAIVMAEQVNNIPDANATNDHHISFINIPDDDATNDQHISFSNIPDTDATNDQPISDTGDQSETDDYEGFLDLGYME